ncbi:MAG: phosphoribosylformylglycinamidine synthase subunit PurL [Pseudomonadota bacterium]|nr:phosphoribosylformylglycinamidine synthase subunit PurL [Pseudomonadota bacterium]MEC9458402.1 phosphoribosylformylglycinamidine synthase subunit PurL [Pseudomonadota bacterium]MEC9481582.1 phosphoribosylformylglycinamidine synthase subunit PurL [Pseudomonadota bacterium]
MTLITEDLVEEHGINEEEYSFILKSLKREPTITELGIFSAMWSEHCSYKSSKFWLKQLPTENNFVIQGPGENAGVIDIGDGYAAIFKMESHNHPSFIEPYQGAATGVGGILRDVFTMGARPVALLNSLRFGDTSHEKTKHLLTGVVSGIGGYGNCMGIPTVGGEVEFNSSYNDNILVNAMCVGIAKTDKIFYSKASGVGNSVVYVGSKTGRDGIHGATMASAEFDENSEEKRPTVQVGDPFSEKLLLEACLELMKMDVIIAIQDMGAAGLTSSAVEMAGKGELGIELDLDKVPCREKNMSAYEIMLSESQERMLMIIEPKKEHIAKEVFDKWELDFSVIGKLTNTNKLVINHKKMTKAEIVLDILEKGAPSYKRPYSINKFSEEKIKNDKLIDKGPISILKDLIGSPNLCSRKWVWEQYDHMVMTDTILIPGGDSAIIRVHGTNKGLSITSDSTPRYCLSDPIEGGKQAVAEAWRNLIAVGSRPIAITDCMNFGNPEKEDIMGQFAGVVKGMIMSCNQLDFPVVSGNVSLYNETNGKGINPTPVIGGVGVIDNLDIFADHNFKRKDDVIFIIGKTDGHLPQSIYATELLNINTGLPPKVNLDEEKKNGLTIKSLIESSLVDTSHDISDGGILIALTEMAIKNNIGFDIETDIINSHRFLFGEDQGRYIISVKEKNLIKVKKILEESNVIYNIAGVTIDKIIKVNEEKIPIDEIKEIYENWFTKYLSK